MIHPVQELSLQQIQAIKDATKQKLLQTAMAQYRGSGPQDWIFRELVLGDSTVTDFYDLDYKTAATAGIPQCVIDAGDLTADDLSSILAATEKIPDETYIGIYGCFDLAVEAGELTGAADTPPSIGSAVSLEFIRGGSVLDFWQIEKLYAYPDVVGMTDRPVIYEKTEKIDIKACFTEDTEDKSFGLRAYLCERRGETIAPFYNPGCPLSGGIDPVQELTIEQINRVKQTVENQLFQMVAEAGLVSNALQAREEYVIRELVAGDSSDATDFVDLDQSATAQTTGQQNWAQDSTVFTAGDLINVIASGQTVPDQKFIGIYGMFDKSANPKTIGLDFSDGAGRKDFWQPEHIYAYHGSAPMGITQRPIFFSQNTPIKVGVNVKTAIDQFVGLRALICEKWGSTLSKK